MHDDPASRRFVQLVITKTDSETFKLSWQDEKECVRGELTGYVDAQAMVIDALSAIDIVDPRRAYR
jgi:hypothetical protein